VPHADASSVVTREQSKSAFFFDLGNLPAKRGLSDVQSMGSACEVQFFSQDNYCS
jgi:hypothetical protein